MVNLFAYILMNHTINGQIICSFINESYIIMVNIII